MTARPTRGACDVVLVFHIDQGTYDGLSLDGLNVALASLTYAPVPTFAGKVNRLAIMVRGNLAAAMQGLVALPLLAGFMDPRLWVHPFEPLFKNVPIIAATVMLLGHPAPAAGHSSS